jgi:hypothetical protein
MTPFLLLGLVYIIASDLVVALNPRMRENYSVTHLTEGMPMRSGVGIGLRGLLTVITDVETLRTVSSCMFIRTGGLALSKCVGISVFTV